MNKYNAMHALEIEHFFVEKDDNGTLYLKDAQGNRIPAGEKYEFIAQVFEGRQGHAEYRKGGKA